MIYCCLTTYPKRVQNVRRVLDSLRAGSVSPDKFVVTIAKQDEWMKDKYLTGMTDVEMLVVPEDTRVWKKFLPAMQHMQPDDLVFTVDDDMIYHRNTLRELLYVHGESSYICGGGAPVSGNHFWFRGFKCHCGCASLVQPRHFAGWEKYSKLFNAVESSDIFYTLLAAKNHFSYAQTPTDWQKVLQPYNEGEAYSKKGYVPQSYHLVTRAFGWH